MKTLDQILGILQFAAEIGTSIAIPGAPAAIGAGSKLAAYLLAIAQAAVKAHEAVTGQPLDLTKLHDITPVS